MKSFDSRIEFEIICCVDMFPSTGITPLTTRIKIRLGKYILERVGRALEKAQTMIVAADSGGQPVRTVLGSAGISYLL